MDNEKGKGSLSLSPGDMHSHQKLDGQAGGNWQSITLVTTQFPVEGYGLPKRTTFRRAHTSLSAELYDMLRSTIEEPVYLHLHTYYFFICINKFIAGLHHELKTYFCFRHCNHHFVNIFNFACCEVFY